MNLPAPLCALIFTLTSTFLFAAEPAKPDKVLKLWEGKPPGDFTAPGPETLTEPNDGQFPGHHGRYILRSKVERPSPDPTPRPPPDLTIGMAAP